MPLHTTGGLVARAVLSMTMIAGMHGNVMARPSPGPSSVASESVPLPPGLWQMMLYTPASNADACGWLSVRELAGVAAGFREIAFEGPLGRGGADVRGDWRQSGPPPSPDGTVTIDLGDGMGTLTVRRITAGFYAGRRQGIGFGERVTLRRRGELGDRPSPFPQQDDLAARFRPIEVVLQREGRHSTGVLYVPHAAEKTRALVVYVNGGPVPYAADDGPPHRRARQVLAARLCDEGVAMLVFNDPGVGGSEGRKRDLTVDQTAADAIAWGRVAASTLETLGVRGRVPSGLIGQSEGSIVVSIAGAHDDSPYSAVALLMAPTTHLIDHSAVRAIPQLLARVPGLPREKAEAAVFATLRAVAADLVSDPAAAARVGVGASGMPPGGDAQLLDAHLRQLYLTAWELGPRYRSKLRLPGIRAHLERLAAKGTRVTLIDGEWNDLRSPSAASVLETFARPGLDRIPGFAFRLLPVNHYWRYESPNDDTFVMDPSQSVAPEFLDAMAAWASELAADKPR